MFLRIFPLATFFSLHFLRFNICFDVLLSKKNCNKKSPFYSLDKYFRRFRFTTMRFFFQFVRSVIRDEKKRSSCNIHVVKRARARIRDWRREIDSTTEGESEKRGEGSRKAGRKAKNGPIRRVDKIHTCCSLLGVTWKARLSEEFPTVKRSRGHDARCSPSFASPRRPFFLFVVLSSPFSLRDYSADELAFYECGKPSGNRALFPRGTLNRGSAR